VRGYFGDGRKGAARAGVSRGRPSLFVRSSILRLPGLDRVNRLFGTPALIDHLQQRAQRRRYTGAGRRRNDQRRLLGRALEPRGLLLEVAPASAHRLC
jgi:hypothetical protein